MNSWNLECIWGIFDAHSIIWLALFHPLGTFSSPVAPDRLLQQADFSVFGVSSAKRLRGNHDEGTHYVIPPSSVVDSCNNTSTEFIWNWNLCLWLHYWTVYASFKHLLSPFNELCNCFCI
jgi:hypothetical protein